MNELSNKIFSDIIVFMKYAKHLPALERRETWEEICIRNRDMHIRKYPKLTDEITAVYADFVIPKKVLPSMRSMQFAGKSIEVSANRMYNCLGKETQFITEHGIKSFLDFEDGDTINVLTHTGSYKEAIVRNYGKQQLQQITFGRGRSTKKIRATKNHRWLLYDGSETMDLKLHAPLYPTPVVTNFDYNTATPFEKLYWCYGYVFGDGTKIHNGSEYKYSLVRLYGADATKYLPRFEEMGFKSSTNTSLNGDIMVYTGKYLKTAPIIEIDGLPLVKAFMDGYLCADGHKNPNWYKNPDCSKYTGIQSSEKDHQLFLEKHLDLCGYYITNIADLTGQVTNYGVRPETYRYGVVSQIGKSRSTSWSAITMVDDAVEDVWCLEVEDDHSFVLTGGIVTGNCCFLPIDDLAAFAETMFLLLGGTGVGYSVQKHHVAKLPSIKTPKKERRFLVSDDIQGWAEAVKVLVKAYFLGTYLPDFDFRDIREKGAMLVTSGGKAPGPEPLKECLFNLRTIFERKHAGEQLTTLEVHDMLCHIADSVLAGGVRRSAMIALFSLDDEDMLTCKFGDWYEQNPQRGRANNTATILRSRVQEEDFWKLWAKIEASGSGEPGLYFTNDVEYGTNPCKFIAIYTSNGISKLL